MKLAVMESESGVKPFELTARILAARELRAQTKGDDHP